jgi:hypothetical protein
LGTAQAAPRQIAFEAASAKAECWPEGVLGPLPAA